MSDYEEILEEAIVRYYSLRNALSRGAILTFVTGERGAGKSYSFKDWSFNDWLAAKKRGDAHPPEWVYARRSGEELSTAKRTFWNDFIYKTDYEISVKGIECRIRPRYVEEIYEDLDGTMRKNEPEPWEPFGWFLSITDAQDYKGNAFPHVNKFCLDEFIIENKRKLYIPGEVDQFLGLLDTVFRKRKMKVVAFSNSGAIANPYFDYYDVSEEDFQNSKWVYRNDRSVLFEYYDGERTEEEIMKLDMAKISGKSYKAYAFNNKFKDSSTELVTDKPLGAKPYLKMTADGSRWYTLYKSAAVHNGRVLWWLKTEDSYRRGFALKPNLVSSDTIYDANFVANMKQAVDSRRLMFDSPDTRARFLADLRRN